MKAFKKGKQHTLCPTANWSICVLHPDHTCPVCYWLHSTFVLPCPFTFWNDRITCGTKTGLRINNTLKRCPVWDLSRDVCLTVWAWQLTVQIHPDIIRETGLQPMLFLAAGLLVSILNLCSHPPPIANFCSTVLESLQITGLVYCTVCYQGQLSHPPAVFRVFGKQLPFLGMSCLNKCPLLNFFRLMRNCHVSGKLSVESECVRFFILWELPMKMPLCWLFSSYIWTRHPFVSSIQNCHMTFT
jgi:hypothetical protein